MFTMPFSTEKLEWCGWLPVAGYTPTVKKIEDNVC